MTTADATSLVGSYAIVPALSGPHLSNYSVTSTNGTLTVTKAALTVTADDTTITYGDAAATFSSTISGFKGSDTSSVVNGAMTL